MPLSRELAKWTDWDSAAYVLGCSLGLFEDLGFGEVKAVSVPSGPARDQP